MPVELVDCVVQINGDMAVATATAIVTDAKGVELSRQTVTAEVNKNLRADDPKRRGLKVDAQDRLAQLLAEKADALEVGDVAKAAEVADFANVKTLATAKLARPAKPIAIEPAPVKDGVR